ncbi:HlyD family efflux transporter periplasmic adaptor subunit [Paenibacillus sp. N3/727]|uniref:efflux RND transporter periplasmic adaptor subunit n=1 Tax=Paenibacillus sp. N3/727 TaxID=2925845 RepID=UPI001F5336F3|nr:HlyD family efflux transporter periplasmic adaptor subunit [Paenibacillus sp. N3/727]UNK19243.1 HlyD family efflux transporter periplasmic adaptor subunit [Paenibacillus sp. N3/727]
MKKIIKWTVLVAVLAFVGYWGYGKMKPAAPVDPMMEAPQVISFPVTEETIMSTVQVKGRSEYGRETNVYTPFEAKVSSWKVVNGQQIKKGDILFNLEQKELRQQLQQKEAEQKKRKLEQEKKKQEQEKKKKEQELEEFILNQGLDNAPLGATEAERLKALAEQLKTLTEQENAQLSSQLEEVNDIIERQAMADLHDKLNLSTYRSPDSGIFLFDSTQKPQPQSVTANQYIGKIVDLNSLRFVAYVDENDVFSIKPGMAVEVKMPSIKDLRLKGKVVEVAKFAEAVTQEKQTSQTPQFKVIISLPKNDRLIGGLTLNGEIVSEQKDKAIVVPKLAVMTEGGESYVMVDKGNGQIERQDIKIGMVTLDKTEVLSGLKAGDSVVLQ